MEGSSRHGRRDGVEGAPLDAMSWGDTDAAFTNSAADKLRAASSVEFFAASNRAFSPSSILDTTPNMYNIGVIFMIHNIYM